MQAPIKLLIPFNALVDAIAVLERDDQLRLRHIIDQHLNNTEENLDLFLSERECQSPLREGLPLTSEPSNSGQSNISIDHDQIAVQHFEADH